MRHSKDRDNGALSPAQQVAWRGEGVLHSRGRTESVAEQGVQARGLARNGKKINVASIGQNPRSLAVPDFRNLGVVLRIVLLINGAACLMVLARNNDWPRLLQELVAAAAIVEPPLIGTVVLLYALQPVMARASALIPPIVVVLVAAAMAVGFAWLFAEDRYLGLQAERLVRTIVWSMLAASGVMLYLRWRAQTYAPALAEARLLALTARIRPHFLFNSLNAVLGVIRSDPRRAEDALEELSELFRVLMQDSRDLTTLGKELALCRQYLDLERLRLGERLRVAWNLDSCPNDALVPPLMLQPLMENAVYHGIEPAAEPGVISVIISHRSDEVFIELSNPCLQEHSSHTGNRMALDNIRERLMLFYDLEARLDAKMEGGEYRVRIRLPYRRSVAS
jgi:two-component system, LytTR family, sensor histidine kinase AlgZ